MKLSQRKLIKKLLLATLTATTLVWFPTATQAAQDVNPDSASNNEVEVREESYTINNITYPVSDNYNFVYGGGYESGSSPAFGNLIMIRGGYFNGIFGGMSMNSAYGNRIIFNGGTVSGGLIGGASIFYGSGTGGDVYNNTVDINGGTIANVSGGEIAYGYLTNSSTPNYSSALGNVYGNTVNVTGGYISNGITGGAALGGTLTATT